MLLGFQQKPKKSGTSHDDYVGNFRNRFRKVTVDCPKAPFGHFLISSMASQAGLTRKEFYDAAGGKVPANWPGNDRA